VLGLCLALRRLYVGEPELREGVKLTDRHVVHAGLRSVDVFASQGPWFFGNKGPDSGRVNLKGAFPVLRARYIQADSQY
jgi:hypothetical protein